MRAPIYISVNGSLYKRADEAPIKVFDPETLLSAWRASKEYTQYLPTTVHRYEGDLRALGEVLRDKFSMWVAEHLVTAVEDHTDWLGEARKLSEMGK